jgi:hypothetical protein
MKMISLVVAAVKSMIAKVAVIVNAATTPSLIAIFFIAYNAVALAMGKRHAIKVVIAVEIRIMVVSE